MILLENIPFMAAIAMMSIACGPKKNGNPSSLDANAVRGDLNFIQPEDPYRTDEALPPSPPDELTALNFLNDVRVAMGSPKILGLKGLTDAAQAHSDFLAANPDLSAIDGHGENKKRPGYSGDSPSVRAESKGIKLSGFWLSEDVARVSDPINSVQRFLSSIYHRSPLLAPGARYAGYARNTKGEPHDTVNLLIHPDITDLKPVAYPQQGARDVPTSFAANEERPQPFPGRELVGQPISVHFPRYKDSLKNKEPTLYVKVFSLHLGSSRTGPEVATILKTASSDSVVLSPDAFLTPVEPLLPSQEYSVSAHLIYGGLEFEENWSFKTSAEPGSRYIQPKLAK